MKIKLKLYASSKFLSDGNKMPFSNSPGYPLLAITTVRAFWGIKSMVTSLRFFDIVLLTQHVRENLLPID